MLKIPDKPYCCVCNKPVNKAIRSTSFLTRETVICVECHGETDTIRISDYDLVISNNPALLFVAFKPVEAVR